MTRMVGTGQAPQGYYEGQVFDVADGDVGTVDDLERKGWARRLEAHEEPGRSKVEIANAMVRGDHISHPADAAVADSIGGHDDALAIVHLEDGDATIKDYEAEAAEGRKRNPLGQPYTDEELRVKDRDAEKAQQGARGGSGTKPKSKKDD